VSKVCRILVAIVQVVMEEMGGTVGSVASMAFMERACRSATAAQVVFAA
jgi:CTP synthase (UTP-ammonia lyase)